LSDWILLASSRKILAGVFVSVLAAGLACVAASAQEKPPQQAPGKYEREIGVPALQAARPVCTVLDAAAAAYSAHGSQGMTLWADDRPVPFTLTINSPQETASAQATILNFHTAGGATDFDLQMPQRKYSAVELNFAGLGRVVSATVTSGTSGVPLGRFTLFDLTAEGGAASTIMRLPERQDALLHVHLDREIARPQLLGAVVPPSRQDLTLFTSVASAVPVVVGPRSVAEFDVQQGVPVERTQFKIDRNTGFRRSVTVQSGSDVVEGVIQRADSVRDGLPLKVEDEAVDSVLPENQHSAMHVTVAVQNAGLRPLPIRQIELQMRQRQICFTAMPGVQHWRLFYGSPTLQFVALGGRSRSLVQKMDPLIVPLGPETQAANFRPLVERPDNGPRRLLVITLCYLGLLGAWLARVLRRARIPHVRR
jgi:hypothetical protein